MRGHLAGVPFDAAAQHFGAEIALARNDVSTALARIEAALADPADRHEKLNTKGQILRRTGDELSAQEAFKAALHSRPDFAETRFNLARLLLQTGRAKEAADHYGRITQQSPDDAESWRGRIAALTESRQFDAVENALAEARLPDTEKRFARASLAVSRGDLDAAEDALPDCIHDEATGFGALTLALQALHLQGRWDGADAMIDDILDAHPGRSDLWLAAISATFKSGDADRAQALLDKAPKDRSLDLVRADILIDRGAYDVALDLTKRLLRAAPGDVSVMQRLCFAALGAGQPELAVHVAGLALQQTPGDQTFHALKGTALRATGGDHGALFDYARFVKAFDLDPPEGWSDMAAFNADLKTELERLHARSGTPVDQTLRHGTQTAFNLVHADSPAIQAFFRAADPAIRTYITSLRRDERHPFLRHVRGGYFVRGAWSVALREGGHHVDHIHPEGWISSAYYVDVPDGSGKDGWIKFGEPAAPLNTALGHGPEFDIEPVAGRLVLFPSYLWHGTYPITGAATRLTLPVDILPSRSCPKFD